MDRTVKTENTIKRLEESVNKTTNPQLKSEIQNKINALKGNKFISK